MARIRFSIAGDIRKDLEAETLKRIGSLTKDRELMHNLLSAYGAIVTQFVPRSDKDVMHHLNQWQLSDNRIVWSRLNGSGEDIADRLYNGETRGTFHARPEYVENHRPTANWTDMVQPGTPEWSQFMSEAESIIRKWVDKNGQK